MSVSEVVRRGAAGLVLVAGLALVAGCAVPAHDRSPASDLPEFRHDATAYSGYGVVLAIRPVQVRGASSGLGAVIGMVAGAAFGQRFGGSANGRDNGLVIGALGGAVVGDAIERDQSRASVVRVTVRLDEGVERDFDFRSAGDLHIGDRVRVQGGQLYRM